MINKLIFIRTDANSKIGMGHIMRCLTVARCLLDYGAKIYFLVSDECALDFLREEGIDALCLNTIYCSMTIDEASKIQRLVIQYHADAIIVDSYYTTPAYLAYLRLFIPVICFYYKELKLPVDILINYNINYNLKYYQSHYADSTAKLLLGSKYVPLRKEFINIHYKIRANVRKVLLMTGGADPCDFMSNFFKHIKNYKIYDEIHFTCISGKYNIHHDRLCSLQNMMENLTVIQTTKNISQLMCQNDIVLSAGGTTLYELCSVGVPTILFSFIDNQIGESQYMKDHKIMAYAGQYGMECFWKNLFTILYDLVTNIEIRRSMSEKMQQVVDGKGASRISNEIIKIIENQED